MLWVASLIFLPWVVYAFLRRWRLLRLEARVLREKYGDSPMFQDFFRRLEAEKGSKRARLDRRRWPLGSAPGEGPR